MKKIYILIIILIILSSFVSASPFNNIVDAYDFSETSGLLQDKKGTNHSTADSISSKTNGSIRGNAWDFEAASDNYVDLPKLLNEKSEVAVSL